MQVNKIPIGQLNPAAYNPRKDLQPGDPEYEKLKRSMQEFGYVEPIVWNKRTGNIVGGHQRYKVLLDMGAQEIDCVVVDLDETKEKALNLALNKIQGDWDYAKLKDLLQELDTGEFDLELTGFDMDEIEDLMTQYHIDFDEFDGEGDGGGSYVSTGNKVRVVIGALMFDINDDDHSIYGKTKNADADIVKAQIMDLINKGELL
jgi:ParB-like chromosome segregation protein Spo0J